MTTLCGSAFVLNGASTMTSPVTLGRLPPHNSPDFVVGAYGFSEPKTADLDCILWQHSAIGGLFSGRAYVFSGSPAFPDAFRLLLRIGGQDNHPGQSDRARMSHGLASGFLTGGTEFSLLVTAFALHREDWVTGEADNGHVYGFTRTALQIFLSN